MPRCQHRAIIKKFVETAAIGTLPTKRQWKDWLVPLSSHVYINFSCQICRALCKTYNRYAAYVDGAEGLRRETCDLFGIICHARDIDIPLALNYTRIDAAQVIPKVLGFSPTTSLIDERMVTARGPQEEANNNRQGNRVVRRRRHMRETRFIPSYTT